MAYSPKISPIKDDSRMPQGRRKSYDDIIGATCNLLALLEGMEEGSLDPCNGPNILSAKSNLKVMRKLVSRKEMSDKEATPSNGEIHSVVSNTTKVDGSSSITPIKAVPFGSIGNVADSSSNINEEEHKDSGKCSTNDVSLHGDLENMSFFSCAPAQKELLTRDEKEYIADTFLKIADPRTEYLSTEIFSRYFTGKNMAKAHNMLRWFDADKSGEVSLDEFMDGLEELKRSDWRKQAEFEFLCMSGDQKTLSEAELYELYRHSLREQHVKEETIVKMSRSLMRALTQPSSDSTGDPTPRSHRVSLQQYLTAIHSDEQLAMYFKFSVKRFLQQTLRGSTDPHEQPRNKSMWPRRSFNECAACGFVAVYAMTSVGVAIFTVTKYQAIHAPTQVIVARVGGAQLNLHTLLLLVSMCQESHLFIASRSMLLSQLLALDFSVQLHKFFGRITFAWVLVHFVGHFANYSMNKGLSAAQVLMMLWHTGVGFTGTALVLLLMIIGLGYALRKRNGPPMLLLRGFELFYITHRLTPIYAAVMIAHAPSCRYWLLPPLGLLMLEWLKRCVSARVHSSYPVVARCHASRVTELVLKRPEYMSSYEAGSYIKICIPELSSWEWHPFSLTSAPGKRDGTLSVHIKSREKDSWTDQLYSLVEKRARDNRREKLKGLACARSYCEQGSGKGLEDDAHKEFVRDLHDITVYVKGPFFGPSMHIFAYEHVVFVAGGIGVTPFAGILEAILIRGNTCNINDYGSTHVHALGRLKVLHFIWLLNDMESTTWFTSLLAAAGKLRQENHDLKRLFHFQIYLTSVASGTKDKTFFAISLDALCDRQEMSNSLLKGLEERTHLGKPKWESVLGRIKRESPHQDKMGLFYCGPPGPSAEIAATCGNLQIDFRSEYFD